jgi:hypothetical protein
MPVSVAADIRPLFTDTDIDHMSFFCDLSNFDDVKVNADDILSRLNGTGGPLMPPVSAGGPLSFPKIISARIYDASRTRLVW